MQRYRLNRKLKLRRLMDRWHISAFLLFCILKTLQIFKKLGFKVEESGWRKFAGVFLRKEHAKFILAAFRLKNYDRRNKPKHLEDSKEFFIRRLAQFLRKNTSCHWCFEYRLCSARRKRIYFTDITEAVYDINGKLIKVIPYLDDTRTTFTKLSEEIIDKTLKKIVVIFNANEEQGIGDIKRAKVISRKLKRWALKTKGLSFTGRRELFHYIDRILSSTFIYFETMPKGKNELSKHRFSTPYMRSRRHPGFGLLNIVCRLTHDFKEVDMWAQYHHVPVDGMPMEEMLEELKKEWGTAGKVKFPSLSTAKPEIRYYGDKVFRGRLMLNFEKFLKVRKYINRKYYSEMGGEATVSSLIIWGLAHRPQFRDNKYVITTDVEIKSDILEDRNIGLIFIRPGLFINEKDPLKGFIEFQKEFNTRIYTTKYGKSETNELLEIYAMVPPAITVAVNFILQKGMKEVIGTAGLTVLKQVEMFISPLTDIQVNGFVSLGNMKVETEDGSTAGAVSFCARKQQIREYIKGFSEISKEYEKFIGIEESELN